nr:UDP-N-acetylglucosamine 2-epimerase [uncultured Methanospirillum sp.]
MAGKRKICVVILSRANYGSIKSVMEAIKNHQNLELQLVVGGSTLIPRYGEAIQVIQKDGFNPDELIYMIVEGENPITMAKSTGLAIIELSTCFQKLQPDVILTVGDRYETMATAISASYMNIPLAQTMGGEVSGTIDESIRHAVTKLANIHFPANNNSAQRIIKMGEDPDTVHCVGCPRIDLVAKTLNQNPNIDNNIFEDFKGVGGKIDLKKPFLLVSQHPVTTEYMDARKQIEETLFALQELKMPTILLWPNIDAGSDLISKGIRTFRENNDCSEYLHVFTNLPPEIYTRLMNNCACIIGNSSSAIREGAFIGVPGVNIGTRQNSRDRAKNIIDVGYNRNEIISAIKNQISNGKYPSDNLYGNGDAGVQIAHILSDCNLSVQKRIMY